MTHPSVTVVIATRDRPELLREALAAVLDQDYPGDVDVIVVFDQTVPETELETTRQGSGPVRTVCVTSNARQEGLAGSRNTGIELARGELVAFCDDDDLWRPTKLTRQVDELRRSGLHLVTCGIDVVYDGESHERSLEATTVSFTDLLRDRHAEMHPSTYLVDRSWLVDRIGLVSEEVPGGFGEDYEFLLRAARLEPVANVPDVLVTVRWSGNSYFFRRWDTMARGLTYLLEAYPEFDQQPRGAARVHGQVAFALAAQHKRREAARWMRSALARNPREPRAYLAAAVATGVVSPPRVMTMLHKRGRGI